MARRLGISRSSLYYKPKRPEIDLEKQYLNATSAIEPNSRIKNLKLIKN